MANTYYSLNIHCIFSTKNRMPLIAADLEERLWAFIGGIARQNNMKALCVGGTADHIHALLSLPTTITVAKAAQLVKGGSSKWVHDTFPEKHGVEYDERYLWD